MHVEFKNLKFLKVIGNVRNDMWEAELGRVEIHATKNALP